MTRTLTQLPLAAIALTLLLGGCVMGNVRPDDPVAIKLNKLESQVEHIQRVTENRSLLQMADRMDQLEQQMRELRGQLEELKHEVDGTQQRQRELYMDIDRRLQSLEAGGSSGQVGASEDDRKAYEAAFEQLKQGRYDQARDAFAAFLKVHPDSPLADNAQYWLGEADYVRSEFKQAIGDFKTLLSKYPDSAKVPDAWLKLGYCHYELKQWDEASKALNTVINRYPDATAARLAKQRLERMHKEGH